MLAENPVNQGITAEDLEKATSVRLFEKAAAAQRIDLNQFSAVAEKLNNTGNGEETMDAVEIFEKVAEAEGIELDTLEDEQLAGLFNHFVEEVLPGMIAAEEGGEVSDEDDVEEAQMKLAEAEILGRHMARAFADEQEKLASEAAAAEAVPGRLARMKAHLGRNKYRYGGGAAALTALGAGGYALKKRSDKKKMEAMKTAAAGSRMMDLLAARNVRKNVAEIAGEGAGVKDRLTAYGKLLAGKADNAMMTSEARKSLAAQLGTAGVLGAGAYGGKKMLDRSRSKEASVEDIEELAQERAFEALIEARAAEILSELE
jgi:hypothetical protein